MVQSRVRCEPGGRINEYPAHLVLHLTSRIKVVTMSQYIMKRLLLLPVLLVIFSIFAFVIIQAPPGDFVTTYIADLAASGSAVDQSAD